MNIMEEKGFKLHFVDPPKDRGSYFKIWFEVEIEGDRYWSNVYISKKYFNYICTTYAILKPEARQLLIDHLKKHRFNKVKYNANYYPEKIRFI